MTKNITIKYYNDKEGTHTQIMNSSLKNSGPITNYL